MSLLKLLPGLYNFTLEIILCLGVVLEPDPKKNQKGESGNWAGVEVYTAPGMQAHFQFRTFD